MISRDIIYNLPNTKRSYYFYKDNKAKKINDNEYFYIRMFDQDVHTGILPIGGISKNTNFSVYLEPPSDHVSELIRIGLKTNYGEPSNLTEAICDFVDETASILVNFGKVVFEIIYFYENEKKQENKYFLLDHIYNNCLNNFFSFYWQILPKDYEFNHDEEKKRFILLPRKKLVVLKIKNMSGSYKINKSFMSKLKYCGKSSFPNLVYKNLAISSYIDISSYTKEQKRILAKVTKKIGWHLRGGYYDYTLEFYQIFRHLKFEIFRANLREYILNELNIALKKIGKDFGFNSKIIIKGIPSSFELNDHVKKLMSGNLQFSEITNALSY